MLPSLNSSVAWSIGRVAIPQQHLRPAKSPVRSFNAPWGGLLVGGGGWGWGLACSVEQLLVALVEQRQIPHPFPRRWVGHVLCVHSMFLFLPNNLIQDVAILAGTLQLYDPPSSHRSLILKGGPRGQPDTRDDYVRASIVLPRFDISAAMRRLGSDAVSFTSIATELTIRVPALARNDRFSQFGASGSGWRINLGRRDIRVLDSSDKVAWHFALSYKTITLTPSKDYYPDSFESPRSLTPRASGSESASGSGMRFAREMGICVCLSALVSMATFTCQADLSILIVPVAEIDVDADGRASALVLASAPQPAFSLVPAGQADPAAVLVLASPPALSHHLSYGDGRRMTAGATMLAGVLRDATRGGWLRLQCRHATGRPRAALQSTSMGRPYPVLVDGPPPVDGHSTGPMVDHPPYTSHGVHPGEKRLCWDRTLSDAKSANCANRAVSALEAAYLVNPLEKLKSSYLK
ncbi:hypothetical protein JB92DRAFT_2836650 [Gautieria morchelliformis]|nr:hypothetical protein JB92DRAFT_2836650 [Gautieria morchelliformis]